MTDAPIDVSYDGGYFDKDEQGWVADPISVVQSGDELLVQRDGRAEIYRLGRRHPHAGFVELLSSERYPTWSLFDLASGRLVRRDSFPRSRMLTRPGAGCLREDPAVLARLVAACAAATRVLYPGSTVAPPGADALAHLLAGPGPSLRLDVPADPGPGIYLLVWRTPGGSLSGCSARSATEVGEPFAAVGLRSSGELDRHVCTPTLEGMDAAFAALEAALSPA
jgi:hypothetical protein